MSHNGGLKRKSFKWSDTPYVSNIYIYVILHYTVNNSMMIKTDGN